MDEPSASFVVERPPVLRLKLQAQAESSDIAFQANEESSDTVFQATKDPDRFEIVSSRHVGVTLPNVSFSSTPLPLRYNTATTPLYYRYNTAI